ncbi:MAG: hypothetical protein HY331_14480, partial [Chloroflexi bacterium]|nr:hypothetical protein [Chloroflexota bacterium]
MKPAVLVLENGAVFPGVSFGAPVQTYGEVVFNTSMTGYQEILTDPSYTGQIVVLTYPLIGNYGVNPDDFESACIRARALVVREACDVPSHWRATMSLDAFLAHQGISGISGVDTRALTRMLRTRGVMMGAISSELGPDELLAELRRLPTYASVNYVEQVSTDEAYEWQGEPRGLAPSPPAPLPLGGRGETAGTPSPPAPLPLGGRGETAGTPSPPAPL